MMEARKLTENIKNIGIELYAGVPDSTLKALCDDFNREKEIRHYTTADEGAAVALAIGEYLSSGRAGCVYMQNSGIGNIVNPITSLAHPEVYGIPMLLLIGWRGEPGKKDEPQHKFMGRITERLLQELEIAYSILDAQTTEEDLKDILNMAKKHMDDQRQYALVVKKGFLENEDQIFYKNAYYMNREEAIRIILESTDDQSCFVTTTGKISREAYEQSQKIYGGHERIFMTVGGMGYASMIAAGIAANVPNQRIYCLDGDGALLMHMGNLAFLGQMSLKNMVHICLNNEAHESVGGMPTGGGDFSYKRLALDAGYSYVARVDSTEGLEQELRNIVKKQENAFLEVQVAISSREDLGRPKEAPKENKEQFMKSFRHSY